MKVKYANWEPVFREKWQEKRQKKIVKTIQIFSKFLKFFYSQEGT